MRAIHVLVGALAVVASAAIIDAAGAKRFDSGEVNVLTDDSFDALHRDGFAAMDRPAIIIFTIPRCRECHNVLSSFREAATRPEADAYFFHVDTMQQLALNERFAGYTQGYPFIVMIKDGQALYVPSWPIAEETIVHFISKGYKVVPTQSSVTGPLSLVGDAWARYGRCKAWSRVRLHFFTNMKRRADAWPQWVVTQVRETWLRHAELSFEQKLALMCLCILVGALSLLVVLWATVTLATRPVTRRRVHAE